MAGVDNEQLVSLTEEVGELVQEIQEENNPEDAGDLAMLTEVHTCLVELATWRYMFPHIVYTPPEKTDFTRKTLH